jgi:hypothetical protein
MPGWDKCTEKLIEEVKKNAGVTTANFEEFFDALQNISVKEKDHLFVAEQCRKYLRDRFPTLIKKIISLKREENKEAKKGLEVLLRLPFYRIVTTNYDNLLLDIGSQCLPETKTEYFTHKDTGYFAEFLRNSDSKIRRSIFHLHGHFDDADSVVLTEAQYQDLYSRREIIELMETIFSTKSALFIGFSMTDFDVMQIFRRIIAQFPSARERHFAILAQEPDESATDLWIRRLRYNYKYGVGILNYKKENESHKGLWKLVDALVNEVYAVIEKPKGNIAILIDSDFPHMRNLYEIVTYLNKVQSKICYYVHHEEIVNLNDHFVAVGGNVKMDKAFDSVKEFGKRHKDMYDGTFLFTNKQEIKNYLFYDRRHIGFISTSFWSKYVGNRPSIDEFLLHTLVLLTLNFYDQKYNKIMNNRNKVFQNHIPDIGCIFDMTVELENRIAIIDYPKICGNCQERLGIAFQGSEIALDLDWLRKVMFLVE